MVISTLTANEIINIASDYRWKYHLNEEDENGLKKLLIEKGRKPFYIFRYLSEVKNFMILSKQLKFTIEIPSEEERTYLEDLNKNCFIKIIKRRKQENVLYNNEIYLTIDVYY